jgi:hypothetical protein
MDGESNTGMGMTTSPNITLQVLSTATSKDLSQKMWHPKNSITKKNYLAT